MGQINGVLKIYEINSERQSTSKINSFFQGQTLEVGYLRYLKILDSRGGMEGGLFQARGYKFKKPLVRSI